MIGSKFGKLTVVERAGSNSHRERLWLCTCECGGTKAFPSGTLNRGKGKSCGCSTPITYKHGLSGTRAHKIWEKMIERCHREKSLNYWKYGARGIAVCDKWRNDFTAFFSDMGDCPPGMSIDRIDNEKGYQPGNCRWATSHEQARNKRNNRWIDVDGRKMIATDAAAFLGMNVQTVVKRTVDGVYRAK